MNECTNIFGGWLKEERTKAKKTLLEVSMKTGLSVPHLSDIEHGRRAPLTTEQIQIVAALFGCSADKGIEKRIEQLKKADLQGDFSDEQRRSVAAALMRRWPTLLKEELEQIRGIVGT